MSEQLDDSVGALNYDEFKSKVFMYLTQFEEGDSIEFQELGKAIGYPVTDRARYTLLNMVLTDIAKTGFISMPTDPENEGAIEGKITWTITQNNKQRI